MIQHPLQSVIRRLRGLVGTADLGASSDGQLLQRFLHERDESAFATLLERHGALVRGVCRYLLTDPADQDDAFQATFLLLVRKAASVRRVESLGPWLHRVACRVALTARRTAARRRTHERQVPSMTPTDPVAEVERHDWAPVLHEEVNRLPDKYRQAVVLCYLEGKSTAEAAELLHWPVGTVKVRLMRARELLHRRLVRRGLALTPVLLAAMFTPGAASAAVAPALFESTLKAAAAVAAGAAPATVAPAAAILVEGVAHAMFLNKVKLAAAAMLVVGVLGSGALWLGTRATVSAVPVTPIAEKAKPGQMTISKPDKNGMVTMFRPVVTQLAAGDPIKVALHWGLENGPIQGDFQNKTVFSSVTPRDATLSSMTISITGPDGKTARLKPEVRATKGVQRPMAFFHQPTYILTLSADSVKEHTGLVGTWADNQKAKLDAAGLYQIKIAGNIVRDKGEPIPFETGTIAMELNTRDIKTIAEVEKIARETLLKKGHKLFEGVDSVVENAEGVRLVKVRGNVPEPPPPPGGVIAVRGPQAYLEFFVPVKPDGSVGAISEVKKMGCIARGTMLDTADGLRPIEHVQIGDRIWGYDANSKKRVLTTVRVVQRLSADKTYVFGGTLRTSTEHPLFVNGAWKAAAEVKADDKLLTADLREVRAGEPKVVYETIDVFDLSVSGPHTFFAGGFLVHNKSLAWTPYLVDTWYHLWPPPAK
jgi:RNA polymerase sigma factor (sigma-70 family)